MSKDTGVFLLNVEEDMAEAITLIEKFRTINNKRFQIRIFYDYSCEGEYGYYKYAGPEKISNLYINPLKCHLEPLSMRQRIGFIDDYTVLSTVLHEFGHFLDFKYSLLQEYDKMSFGDIELGKYAKTELMEEFAELMVMYLINPYFLQLIDTPRYKFLKRHFKSPSPCSKKRFLTLYEKWSDEAKLECEQIFNITVENGIIKV